jgi:alkanesulfonate monooxygenase SsuD/methylene tetrahydromethanopterin reductase-like flavin-dependent oxidoreductase (luciferase family)
MKFGVALPYCSARAAADLAQLAEEAGWDGCFMGDAIWCEDPLICLTAAAMVTRRIRLGTMVIPVPLRQPWKIASESLALDRLSGGRLILGLATGATFMGWQCFPDVPVDQRIRSEMLDETIDILTLLYQRRPFDYDGKHYHLRLTRMDIVHFPPMPQQQPRIPLWVPGVWGSQKSMQRVLKCDGVIIENPPKEGQRVNVTLADVRAVKNYVDANRTLTTPFDIIVDNTAGLTGTKIKAELSAWDEAGATWWIEGMWGDHEDQAADKIRRGPPPITQ